MKRASRWGALTLALLALFPATTVPQVTDGVPRFEPGACPFPAPRGVACGDLVVPEDRMHPADSRAIRLAVAIVRSRSDSPAPDPVAFLAGGPGSSAVAYASEPLDSPFLDTRDLILVDQRGAGYSEPHLACPEWEAALVENLTRVLSDEEETAREVEAAIRCRDRLIGEGVDLAAYNTAASAADLDALRRVLGYAQWNLYGVSYGTRLALTVMRDYPGGVRSAVLDSANPPNVDEWVALAPAAASAFGRLLAACAADPACASAYPDLEADLYTLVDRLNGEPLAMAMVHPLTGENLDLLLTGSDIADGLVHLFFSPASIRSLPAIIRAAGQGNLNVLRPAAEGALYARLFPASGMTLSVQCHDEAPFNAPPAVAAAMETVPPPLRNLFFLRFQATACPVWAAGDAGPIEDEPVASDIPTLVLAGEYDPVTPPAWGQLTTETLGGGFYFEFPGLSHGVTGAECPRRMAAAFVDNPTAAPDAGCIDRMPPVRFAVGR